MQYYPSPDSNIRKGVSTTHSTVVQLPSLASFTRGRSIQQHPTPRGLTHDPILSSFAYNLSRMETNSNVDIKVIPRRARSLTPPNPRVRPPTRGSRTPPGRHPKGRTTTTTQPSLDRKQSQPKAEPINSTSIVSHSPLVNIYADVMAQLPRTFRNTEPVDRMSSDLWILVFTFMPWQIAV